MNELPVNLIIYIFRATSLYLQKFNANLLHNRMLQDYKICNVLNQLYKSQCLRLRIYFSGLNFSSHLLHFLVRVIVRGPFHPVF
jgi:hypothetical protein